MGAAAVATAAAAAAAASEATGHALYAVPDEELSSTGSDYPTGAQTLVSLPRGPTGGIKLLRSGDVGEVEALGFGGDGNGNGEGIFGAATSGISWFHGQINRKIAEQRLGGPGATVGSYLLRCTRRGTALALSLRLPGGCSHHLLKPQEDGSGWLLSDSKRNETVSSLTMLPNLFESARFPLVSPEYFADQECDV